MTLPTSVRLLSQRINVREEPNLHCPDVPHPKHDGESDEPKGVPSYGVYDEAEQSITLDIGLHFERQRETFLHENLHAMIAVGQLDGMTDMVGWDEHLVATLSPILLCWMRSNPEVMQYLMEMQP